MSGEKEDDWDWLGVYLYRADGTYYRAEWIRGPAALEEMLPRIRKHMKKRLEVTITNSEDEMLFHTLAGRIEWDGLGLTRLMPV